MTDTRLPSLIKEMVRLTTRRRDSHVKLAGFQEFHDDECAPARLSSFDLLRSRT
jgi:hypothetical protein